MALDMEAVNRAIIGTREGLEASGFALDCTDQDGRLRLTIRALEGACEDCLVPKPVFTSILSRELGDGGVTVKGIDVVYPVEVGDSLN